MIGFSVNVIYEKINGLELDRLAEISQCYHKPETHL